MASAHRLDGAPKTDCQTSAPRDARYGYFGRRAISVWENFRNIEFFEDGKNVKPRFLGMSRFIDQENVLCEFLISLLMIMRGAYKSCLGFHAAFVSTTFNDLKYYVM